MSDVVNVVFFVDRSNVTTSPTQKGFFHGNLKASAVGLWPTQGFSNCKSMDQNFTTHNYEMKSWFEGVLLGALQGPLAHPRVKRC